MMLLVRPYVECMGVLVAWACGHTRVGSGPIHAHGRTQAVMTSHARDLNMLSHPKLRKLQMWWRVSYA